MQITPTQSVAAELRAEMGRRRLTASALADQLGLGPQAVRNRLAGQTPMTLDDLGQICDALGVPLAEMVTRSEALRLTEVSA